MLSEFAYKAPCCAACDRHVQKLADQAVVSREADESSALGAGGEQVLVAAVAEHADGLADVALMNFQRNAVLHGAEPVKAAVFLLLGRRVVHFRGRRPRARGEDKGKQRVIAHVFDQADRVLEFLLRLAGEADDHVASQNQLGHDLAAIVRQLQIFLAVIVSVHGLQHPVIAGLERQVELLCDLGVFRNGVKELFVTGMLLAARDVVGGIEWAKENADNENISKDMEKAKKQFAGTELMGKKIGVIGLGAIGVLVANVANRMKMDVYGVDPFLSVNNALSLSRDVKIVKSYEEIYKNCDYITIHVPLLEDTKGMLNKEAFDKMKDGVVLLNFARDLLVDEDALIEALDSGKVKKYVTDFANATVAGRPGILVTPHLGASTEESEENCAVMAVKEVRDFLENGNIKNSVNFPNCDMGTCVAVGRITICHKNIPNMISQFTKILGSEGLNIADMTNKSRGGYAYTIIDLESAASKEALDELRAIEGVSKVRVIK